MKETLGDDLKQIRIVGDTSTYIATLWTITQIQWHSECLSIVIVAAAVAAVAMQ